MNLIIQLKIKTIITKTQKNPSHVSDFRESVAIYDTYITIPFLHYCSYASVTKSSIWMCVCVRVLLSMHQHDLCFKDTAG